MAPRGSEARRLLALLLLRLAAFPAFADPPTDADLLARAESLYRAGDTPGSLDALRTLRSDYADSPLIPRSLSLGVRAASAAGDPYTARWFLDRLIATGREAEETRQCALLMGDEAYGRGDRTLASEYYGVTLELWPAADRGAVRSRVLLRLSETAFYVLKDARASRTYHGMIDPDLLSSEERTLYRVLWTKLRWEALRPEDLGMVDGNVSALRIDGDDLWVGTWNGGVARLSLSTGERQVAVSGADSLAADTVRCIEVSGSRVWVGTFEGLSYFSKTTSAWYKVPFFGGADPMKITSARDVGGDLYVGTLGSGLFRLRAGAEAWEKVAQGALPGDSVNCIAALPGSRKVLLGTLKLGLLVLDPDAGTLQGLSETHPEFEPKNITCLLVDGSGLWVGTYGEGLWHLASEADVFRRFGKSTGELGDDWVLCAVGTEEALYFGTFGSGVSVRPRGEGTWRTLGVRDGILSLDVAAAAAGASRVFFGTLGQGVSVLWETAASRAQP